MNWQLAQLLTGITQTTVKDWIIGLVWANIAIWFCVWYAIRHNNKTRRVKNRKDINE